MNFLLDHCVPRVALRSFESHEVQHCSILGWSQLANGELLRTANGKFDVLVTIDKNMQFQSSLNGLQICVAVLNVRGNLLSQLESALRRMLENPALLAQGEFVVIEP